MDAMRYGPSKSATISTNENASISDCDSWKARSQLSLMIPVGEGKSCSGNNDDQELYNSLSLCTMCPCSGVHQCPLRPAL